MIRSAPRYSIESAGANLKRIGAYRFEEPGKGLKTTQLLNQGAAILGTQSRGTPESNLVPVSPVTPQR